MAEACRARKGKLKTSDLIAQLEKLEVADHPLPEVLFEENNKPSAHSKGSPSQNSANSRLSSMDERNVVIANDQPVIDLPPDDNAMNKDVSNASSNLYPNLDALKDTFQANEIDSHAITASAPLLDSRSKETIQATLEYTLPSPLTTDRLRNLYVNISLDRLDSTEFAFVKNVLDDFRAASVSNDGKDFFQILINNYAHQWSQWQHAMDRFQMVRRDATQLKLNSWRVHRKTSKVTGKCSDGVSVSFEYAFDEATFDESVSKELMETQDVMRWIIFEELPEVAYDLARLRNQISEHILGVLSITDVYRSLAKSEPVQLLKSDNNADHIRQIQELRWIVSVLFAALRRHFSSEFQGQSIDPSLAKQLCEWLLLSASAMVRFCRAEDHLFLLMHILRLPSKLLKPLSTLLQPPDPTIVWNRCGTIPEFLEQPEVELHLTLFAACLRPVRSRKQFLLATNSETNDIPDNIDLPTFRNPDGEHPWVLVDSAGESDSEESLLNPAQKTSETAMFSQTIQSESSLFVGPHDLDRLLRQLDLKRLIQLLGVDVPSGSGLGIKSYGLMTLMAFANRMLDLIEACGEIYSQQLQAPKSRDHLGSWRILAKRLASLVSALVTSIGSRVRLAWSQGQPEQQASSELLRVLAQYDAFCLRAAQCLLSGCGLPSTHRDAVRLIGWRYLAQLFPFGLASSRIKVEFLYLIIIAVLPSWKPKSVPLPNLAEHVIGPLHRALLSTRMNDVGLGSIITTLGKLASIECRPIAVPIVDINDNCAYSFHLPELEAMLVRSITSIIFGLSVYHDHRLYDTDTSGTQSGPGPLGLLPIAPDHGRQQLVKIVCAHPESSLSLLFQLIVITGEQLPVKSNSSVKEKMRPILGPYRFDECIGTEKLLLLLAAEAPFNYLRPSCDHIDNLVDWLVNRSPNAFVHVLARTLLHRLNWESYLNPESGEPFLPLTFHIKVALGVAKLVEKRISHPARFTSIQHHPVVEQILSSGKSTASSAAGLLLTTLGYRQLAIGPSKTATGARRASRDRQLQSPSSYITRRSSLATQRSRSQCPADEDDLLNLPDQDMSWCVDLVIRMHFPGCAINLSPKPPSSEDKENLMNFLQQLMLLKFNRNPLAAFLVLSVYCALFSSSTETISLPDTLRTIADSFHWKLILRALSIIFHQSCSHSEITQMKNLTDTVSELLRPAQTGHLRITTGSRFASLFVGACLDACLHYSHNCAELLKSLSCSLLQQSDWFVRPDSLWFLDYLLRMDFWINQYYIPSKFGAQGNFLRWSESVVFKILKDKLKFLYSSRVSGDASSWSEQLGSVATIAWHHSFRALFALRSRLTGYEQSSTSAQDFSQPYEIPDENKSILALFWSDLRHLCDNVNVSSPPFSWWLITLMNLFDYELQTADSIGAESISSSGSWFRLVPVLTRHVDEIAVNVQKRLTASESDCPMHPSLVVLLERIFLEAGLLSPKEDSEGPFVAGLSTSLIQRIQVVLSQLAIVQTVSLLVACPPGNPVFVILLYTLLNAAFSSTNKTQIDPPAKFPVGLLLLRCIPWSFCNLGCTSSEMAFMLTRGSEPADRRSLLSVLIDKLRWTVTTLQRENRSENLVFGQSDIIQALRRTVELLNDLDSTSARDARLYTNNRLLCVNRTTQKEVLDGLLFAFDWNTITSDLYNCIEQWNEHRGMSVVRSNVLSDNQTAVEPINLHVRHPLTGPTELPYYSLDSLLSASVSSYVPASVHVFPKLIQDLRNNLLNQTKRLCDYINNLEELQGAYVNTLMRQLYTITNVREHKCVECRSIFPAWMVRSKRCLGGAILTWEYQTALMDHRIHTLCNENGAKVDDILNVLTHEAQAAACGTPNLSLNQDQWSESGLRIEAIVRHLIELSRQAQATDKDPNAVKAVGMQCFEQLCQNLSGPLLIFPVSKKLLAECIRQLADEFLTSLSAGYERVLDLMVALPHLSAVLTPTFVPPNPFPHHGDDPHPLTSLFKRLMDVRVRCSAEAALAILQKVDMSAWCQPRPGQESFLPIASQKRYTEFLTALYNSVKQTSVISSDQNAHDKTLHELYVDMLKSVLRNRLSESLSPMMELLMNDICTPKSAPLWIIMQQILMDEEEYYGKSVLSIEKLIVVLNKISSDLTKPLGSSDVGQDMIWDQFLRFPCEFVQTVVAVYFTLLLELSGKLGCCVRERHMTCFCAILPLMDCMTGVLGGLLVKSCVLACRSEADTQKRGIYLVRIALTCISDVLAKACEACSVDDNPNWSSSLVDSFIHWLMTAQCASMKSGQFSVELRSVPLAVMLCMIDGKVTQQIESSNPWSSLCLSWSSWHPSTNALDSMVGVISWCSGPGTSLHVEQRVASLILYCLRYVDWSSRPSNGAFLEINKVSNSQSNWYPADADTEPESVTIAGSITFLCLLLAQSLHESEIKDELKLTIEAIVSGSDLSEVGERCYTFILSNMNELRLPAHCVLMPPTSLEGRLFGLLASAGGMSASQGNASVADHHIGPSVQRNLYPQVNTLSIPALMNPRALHRKRLCYVQKVVSLLKCALLRGHIPSKDLDLLKTGPLAPANIQPLSGSDETRYPTLFTRLLVQPINLFKKFLPSVPNLMDSESDDPTRIVAVLGWLRVGNLLSELEAVAKPCAWADPSSVEFKELAELCAEVISLIQFINRQSTIPASPATSEEHRLNLLCSSIVAWILGAQATTGLVDPYTVPRVSMMPRSIHAGLSKPLCYTVLVQTTPSDQVCVSAMVRVLEASIWSILTLAPNDMPSLERFGNLNAVFMEALAQPHSEALFASNSLIYCCLREASLLPLFFVATSRAKRFNFIMTISGDGPQILLADILHWISTADWRMVSPNNPAKLSGLLLLFAFVVRMLCCTDDQSGCCSHHPAWKTETQASGTFKPQCAAQKSIQHFTGILTEVQKVLTLWKVANKVDLTTFEHVNRLLNLVNCVGSLSEAWLGVDLDSTHANFKPLNALVNLTQNSSNPESSEERMDKALESIVSALLARLPNFTFIEAFNYLCFHFWPDIHPHVKQILTSFQE